MTSLSQRPLRSMVSGGGGRTGHGDGDVDGDKDNEKKRDSSCVVVICVGKVGKVG